MNPVWHLEEVQTTGDAVLELIQPGLEYNVAGQRRRVPRSVIYAWMSAVAVRVVTCYTELPGAREHEVEWLATAALLIREAADAHTTPTLQHDMLSLHGMIQPLPLIGGVSLPPGPSAVTLVVDLYTWAIKRVLRLRHSPHTCAELARRAREWHSEHAAFMERSVEEARSRARRDHHQALLDLLAEVA